MKVSNNSIFKSKYQIILASGSSARKKLLLDLKIPFKAIPSSFDEEAAKKSIKHLSIKDQAMFLANGKALAVSADFKDTIVIGSDQICSLDGKVISKSKNQTEAIEQLKKLQGKIHHQNNAIFIYKNSKVIFRHFEKSSLAMRKLSDSDIEKYVELDQSFGCAGSYKIESLGKHLFTKISGNQDSIAGMNVTPILNFLYKKKFLKFDDKL